MEIQTKPNRVDIELKAGESFYIKPRLLSGVIPFDWTILPPHAWGSPILRLYYQCWFMKRVQVSEPCSFSVYGDNTRGDFHVLKLAEGEKYHVATRTLAGFSADIKSIHTRIKLGVTYWLFHEHFFSVFQGPGTVLLYSPSNLERSTQTSFNPERIVAFNTNKSFRAVAPSPSTLASQLINFVFSHEVIWEFKEPGEVIAEANSGSEAGTKNGLARLCKHLISFLKL